MKRLSIRSLAAVLSLGACWGVVRAQPGIPPGAHRVDPGIGDVGAIPGVSRVDLYKEMRYGQGFGTVYRLDYRPSMGAPGSQRSVYMRTDGGLTAVFPESVYNQTPWGLSAEVPPGTTFYIGKLPAELSGATAPVPKAPNYVQMRVDLSAQPVPALPVEPAAASPTEGMTIWEDEAYRQRMLARLMRRAASAR